MITAVKSEETELALPSGLSLGVMLRLVQGLELEVGGARGIG